MNSDRFQPRFDSTFETEPLPDEFALELRDLDARLGAMARQSAVPVGMSDRVLIASIAAKVSEQPQLRLVGSGLVRGARPLHQQAWARLAMAACLTVVCGLGVLMMQPTANDRRSELASGTITPGVSTVSFTLRPSHESAAGHYEDNLGYLLETNSMTTDDLANDIAMLASRF